MSHRISAPARILGALLVVAGTVVAGGCSAATPSPAPAPATVLPAPTAGPSVAATEEFTVEEYPIVAQGEDRPDRLEFNRRIDAKILDKRRAWRGFTQEGWGDSLNRSLAPFGYRLMRNERSGYPSPLYNLLRGEDVLLRDIVPRPWPLASSAGGNDFALVVETRQGQQSLIRPSGVERWDSVEHAFTRPVFVDNDLVTLDLREDHGLRLFAIVRAGRPVHISAQAPGPVSEPIKGLWSWDGHWVLEVDGKVLVDGKNLNQEMGYDEVFGWRLIQGKPFYFFRKDGGVGVSYAGQQLTNRYEEVIHYKCCEPAAFNAAGNDTMVWFHALKDRTWHYVEMGVFDEVIDVEAGSVAEQAGIQRGDMLKTLNDAPVASAADAARIIGQAGQGQRLTVVLRRGGRDVTLEVVIARVPAHPGRPTPTPVPPDEQYL